MWFEDPGEVREIKFAPAAKAVLKRVPDKELRDAWRTELKKACESILTRGTVLATKEYVGTFNYKNDEWKMPAELGIYWSVDGGRATARLVNLKHSNVEIIAQVLSYRNGSNLIHFITIGELLPAGSRSHFDPTDYEDRLREVDELFRTLRNTFAAPAGREERYLDLLRLAEFLRRNSKAVMRFEPANQDQEFEVPDWFALTPAEFEQAVAKLCSRDGCTSVQVIGKAGDLGADVIAITPDGRKMVIQCKQYRGRVSSPDLQRFAGTVFQVHQADVALLVTTGSITTPAAGLAQTTGIGLVDADHLNRWARGEGKLPWDD